MLALNGCTGSWAELTLWLEAARTHPAAPLLVVALFIASGFVAAPLTVVMVPVFVVFGPLEGALWTLIGATASAALFFHLGASGSAIATRLGARFSEGGRLARLLARDGILAVAVARNLPLPPYPIVNLALGALPLRFSDFLIGNTIGLLPWLALYAVFGAQLRAFIAAPSVGGAVWTGVGIACVTGASFGGARLAAGWLARRRPTSKPSGS